MAQPRVLHTLLLATEEGLRVPSSEGNEGIGLGIAYERVECCCEAVGDCSFNVVTSRGSTAAVELDKRPTRQCHRFDGPNQRGKHSRTSISRADCKPLSPFDEWMIDVLQIDCARCARCQSAEEGGAMASHDARSFKSSNR